jgi:hypothetical protein
MIDSELIFFLCDALMLFGGFYVVFIAPILFRFWIIPKIEDRYGKYLRPTFASAPIPFAKFELTSFELAVYIFFKKLGIELRGMKKPASEDNMIFLLKKINYDIKKASKAEIIMSFITVFFIIWIISMGIFIFVEDKILGNI